MTRRYRNIYKSRSILRLVRRKRIRSGSSRSIARSVTGPQSLFTNSDWTPINPTAVPLRCRRRRRRKSRYHRRRRLPRISMRCRRALLGRTAPVHLCSLYKSFRRPCLLTTYFVCFRRN